MRKYNKKELKNSDIVVIDLEALNYTKEAISIGAVVVKYSKSKKTFSVDKENCFKSLIKPQSKNRVDRVIESLTGITNEMLKTQGLTFVDCINQFTNFISELNNPLFLCYGNFDEIILKSSFKRCPDKKMMEFFNYIKNRLIDYSKVSSDILRYSNTISLINAVNELGLEPNGRHHDALNDAIDLANVFVKIENDKKLCVHKCIETFSINCPQLQPYFEKLESIINREIKFSGDTFSGCPFKKIYRIKELIKRLYSLDFIDNNLYVALNNKIKSHRDLLNDFLKNPTSKNKLLSILEQAEIDVSEFRENKDSLELNLSYLKKVQGDNKDCELLLSLLFFDVYHVYMNKTEFKNKLTMEITEIIVDEILSNFEYSSSQKKNIKFYINALNMKKITPQKLNNLRVNCNGKLKYENIIEMHRIILLTQKEKKISEISEIDSSLSVLK